MSKNKKLLSTSKEIHQYIKYAQKCGAHFLASCIFSDRVGNWYLTNTKYFITIPNFVPDDFEQHLQSQKKKIKYFRHSKYFLLREESHVDISSMLDLYLNDKTGYNVTNYRSPYSDSYSVDGDILTVGNYELLLDEYLKKLLVQEQSCYTYNSPSFQKFHSDKPSAEEYDAFRLVIGNYTVYTIMKTRGDK